jgi:hypothetical protein
MLRTVALLSVAACAQAFLVAPSAHSPLRSRGMATSLAVKGMPKVGRCLGQDPRGPARVNSFGLSLKMIGDDDTVDKSIEAVDWISNPALLQECEPEGTGSVMPLFPLGGYVYLVRLPPCKKSCTHHFLDPLSGPKAHCRRSLTSLPLCSRIRSTGSTFSSLVTGNLLVSTMLHSLCSARPPHPSTSESSTQSPHARRVISVSLRPSSRNASQGALQRHPLQRLSPLCRVYG